jgi:hypothetical protein
MPEDGLFDSSFVRHDLVVKRSTHPVVAVDAGSGDVVAVVVGCPARGTEEVVDAPSWGTDDAGVDVVEDGAVGRVVTVVVAGSMVVLVGTVVVVDRGTVVDGVGVMLISPFEFTWT